MYFCYKFPFVFCIPYFTSSKRKQSKYPRGFWCQLHGRISQLGRYKDRPTLESLHSAVPRRQNRIREWTSDPKVPKQPHTKELSLNHIRNPIVYLKSAKIKMINTQTTGNQSPMDLLFPSTYIFGESQLFVENGIIYVGNRFYIFEEHKNNYPFLMISYFVFLL